MSLKLPKGSLYKSKQLKTWQGMPKHTQLNISDRRTDKHKFKGLSLSGVQ